MNNLMPIWPPLFIAAVLAIAIAVWIKCWPWADGGFDFWIPIVLGGLFVFIACVVAAALGCAVGSGIGACSEQVWNNNWSANLATLRSSDGVSGRVSGGMFLFSGVIGESQTFHYYTIMKDGSLRPSSWTANNDTFVFEEDRTDGMVMQFDEQFKRPWMKWFGFSGDRLRMEFHIPKGSLQREFKLQ